MMRTPLSSLSLVLVFSWLIHLLSTTAAAATTRQYYITAEEIDWDYAPRQWDNLRDQPLNQSFMADLYTARNATRLGTIYRKAIIDNIPTIRSPFPWLMIQLLDFLALLSKQKLVIVSKWIS
ncbi:unnamed protein product [Absidia cylindrospora]